jgi:hypothetical protein
MKREEFLGKVKDVVTAAVKEARSSASKSNTPSPVARAVTATRAARPGERGEGSVERELDEVLDAVEDALSALDQGRKDEAAEILDDVLGSEDEE